MFQKISAGRFHRCSFDFRSEAEFLKVSLCRCGDIIFPLRAELMAHTARVHFRAIVVGGAVNGTLYHHLRAFAAGQRQSVRHYRQS
jgi:hypothetical protein